MYPSCEDGFYVVPACDQEIAAQHPPLWIGFTGDHYQSFEEVEDVESERERVVNERMCETIAEESPSETMSSRDEDMTLSILETGQMSISISCESDMEVDGREPDNVTFLAPSAPDQPQSQSPLKQCDREDIMDNCMFNVKMVTDNDEAEIAQSELLHEDHQAQSRIQDNNVIIETSENKSEHLHEEMKKRSVQESRTMSYQDGDKVIEVTSASRMEEESEDRQMFASENIETRQMQQTQAEDGTTLIMTEASKESREEFVRPCPLVVSGVDSDTATIVSLGPDSSSSSGWSADITEDEEKNKERTNTLRVRGSQPLWMNLSLDTSDSSVEEKRTCREGGTGVRVDGVTSLGDSGGIREGGGAGGDAVGRRRGSRGGRGTRGGTRGSSRGNRGTRGGSRGGGDTGRGEGIRGGGETIGVGDSTIAEGGGVTRDARTASALNKKKVAELRGELSELGLPTNGIKADLVQV